MSVEKEFPWYIVLFGQCVLVLFTYAAFLMTASAMRQSYKAHVRGKWVAESGSVGSAVFRPSSAFFRIRHGKDSMDPTRIESGLAGEFSVGKETFKTEMGWDSIKAQVIRGAEISGSGSDPVEIGIYKRLIDSRTWRISSIREPITQVGTGSTGNPFFNEILRSIDTTGPYQGPLPPLEVRYLKRDPRLTEDFLAAYPKSGAVKMFIIFIPICIFAGVVFSRLVPYAWPIRLLVTIFFFLVVYFTLPQQWKLVTGALARIEFMNPDLFIYEDGVLRKVGKGNA